MSKGKSAANDFGTGKLMVKGESFYFASDVTLRSTLAPRPQSHSGACLAVDILYSV